MIKWEEWEFGNVGKSLYDVGIDEFFAMPIAKHSLLNNKVVYRFYKSGEFDSFDEVCTLIESSGLNKISVKDSNGSITSLYYGYAYMYSAMCSIEIGNEHGTDYINMHYNDLVYEDLKNKLSELVIRNSDKSGNLYALVATQDGLDYQKIGSAYTELVRDNYSEVNLAGYDYIISQLNSKTPFGRIAILDGPPGTGKSFMIRGLIGEVTNSVFILIPPNMVSSLGTPNFIPFLLKMKSELSKSLEGKSMTLILEDADDVLAPRMADNISSISAILNLGDGLLGSSFDIRIVATSNAKHKDMDPAILRPGRLIRRLDIGPLSSMHANVLLDKLTNGACGHMPVQETSRLKPLQEVAYTLAEVYDQANKFMGGVQ